MGRKLQLSEETKVVQRETLEGKKKSSVMGELSSLVEKEKESLVMERKWSLVEKDAKMIRKLGCHLRGGGVQSPEISIEKEEGFNLTQKPAGGK